MKKQARMMQEQFAGMQSKLQATEVTGTAGAGLVTVTLNGEKTLRKILIKPDCVNPSDVEGLQDLILAAFEDAFQKLENQKPASGLPFNFG